MVELDPQVEQQLADMSDHDWRSLSARVRPPTSNQQLETEAAKIISDPDQLKSFMAIANPKAFANEIGDIDPDKVKGHLTAFYGANEPRPQRNWGQASGPPGPPSQPGDQARAALKRRHNVGADNGEPGSSSQIPRGRGAREELAKRYPKGGRR
jgi:hypothetical protein